jgi:hypothetical protein
MITIKHMEEKEPTQKPASKNEFTLQTAYETPLLQTLQELGGGAPIRQVYEHVHRKMKTQFTTMDYELRQGGRETRWESALYATRMKMIEKGYMKSDSPRGTWEITPRWKAYLAPSPYTN